MRAWGISLGLAFYLAGAVHGYAVRAQVQSARCATWVDLEQALDPVLRSCGNCRCADLSARSVDDERVAQVEPRWVDPCVVNPEACSRRYRQGTSQERFEAMGLPQPNSRDMIYRWAEDDRSDADPSESDGVAEPRPW